MNGEQKISERQEHKIQQKEMIEIMIKMIEYNKNDEFISLWEEYDYVDLNQTWQSGWNPLHLASYTGNDQIVFYLLETKNVDPNVITKDLLTALHLAIFKQNVEVVRLLLENSKTDVNIVPDVANGTPLHFAANADNIQVVFLLLMYGSDVKLVDSKEMTPKNLTNNIDIINLIN